MVGVKETKGLKLEHELAIDIEDVVILQELLASDSNPACGLKRTPSLSAKSPWNDTGSRAFLLRLPHG
jgi:hypothetical protein